MLRKSARIAAVDRLSLENDVAAQVMRKRRRTDRDGADPEATPGPSKNASDTSASSQAEALEEPRAALLATSSTPPSARPRVKRRATAAKPEALQAATLRIPSHPSQGITSHQLLHFTFDGQGLVERHAGVSRSHLPLHATRATTPIFSLLARVKEFDGHSFHSLCDGTHDKLQLSLSRCMRGTLHYLPSEVLDIVHSLYGLHLHDAASVGKWEKSFKVRAAELEALQRPILDVLRAHGPRSSTEVTRLLGPGIDNGRPFRRPGDPSNYGPSTVTLALRWLWYSGQIEYGVWDHADSWRSGTRKFRLRKGLPIKTAHQTTEDLVELAVWYFRQYGPASMQDFVWWSGLSVVTIRACFADIIAKAKLVPVTVRDDGRYGTLYITADNAPLLASAPDEPVVHMARFLPYEDAIVKAYKETRFRFFGDKESCHLVEALAMTRGGELNPCVWAHGRPVGTWKHSLQPGHPVSVALFNESVSRMSSKQAQALLRSEATAMCAFLEAREIQWS